MQSSLVEHGLGAMGSHFLLREQCNPSAQSVFSKQFPGVLQGAHTVLSLKTYELCGNGPLIFSKSRYRQQYPGKQVATLKHLSLQFSLVEHGLGPIGSHFFLREQCNPSAQSVFAKQFPGVLQATHTVLSLKT